jgi:hypothetical protein
LRGSTLIFDIGRFNSRGHRPKDARSGSLGNVEARGERGFACVARPRDLDGRRGNWATLCRLAALSRHSWPTRLAFSGFTPFPQPYTPVGGSRQEYRAVRLCASTPMSPQPTAGLTEVTCDRMRVRSHESPAAQRCFESMED